MVYQIKDLSKLTIAMFEGFETEKEAETMEALEKAETENDLIFWHLMEILKTGVADAIKQTSDSGNGCHIYTRSIYEENAIQNTFFRIDNAGDYIPQSHETISLKDKKYFGYGFGDFETFKF